MTRCCYINLDSAELRRKNLEASWAKHGSPLWDFSRFRALDVEYVKQREIPGSLKPVEKACFLSHKQVIKEHLELGSNQALLVLEDDALLGKSSCAMIDQFLTHRAPFEWDLIYTDVGINLIESMLLFAKLRHKLTQEKQVSCLDLPKAYFFASTAYVLNPKSIKKIYDLIDQEGSLDYAYDNVLMKLIQAGKIKAFTFFPFLTSVNELADSSQIQIKDQKSLVDSVLHLFRRIMWIDRDLLELQPFVEALEDRMLDGESQEMAGLFSLKLTRLGLDKSESKYLGIILAAHLKQYMS